MRKKALLLICIFMLSACDYGVKNEIIEDCFNKLLYIRELENGYYIEDSMGKEKIPLEEFKTVADFKISPKGNSALIVGNKKDTDSEALSLYLVKKGSSISKTTEDYRAVYPKWSPGGDKIAYMPYTGNEPSSNMGIYIIDSKGVKKSISGDKLISRSLYNWVGNDNIIYYGMDTQNKNLKTIYGFDLKRNVEYVFYDKISGFCDFMDASDDGDKLIIGNGFDKKLKYVDIKTGKENEIDFLYEYIYDGEFSKDGKHIALAAKQYEEDKPHLFIYSIESNHIYKATMDFPENISIHENQMIWNGNQVYFMGDEGVFSFNTATREIKRETQDDAKTYFPQYIAR